ncbi:MAG TPA: hypothetical protein PL117_18205, partial [Accumulibacter sp.]|uniref:RNA recognition motif domain-containing protein n=2 Tax=Accumulibacter sp. TaxID=2053492 RepID=UPI002B78868A
AAAGGAPGQAGSAAKRIAGIAAPQNRRRRGDRGAVSQPGATRRLSAAVKPSGAAHALTLPNPSLARSEQESAMNIFVGNLATETSETELTSLFQAFGQVKSVQVMRELFSGASKGFGFVEMPGKAHSLAAISALDGKDLNGKPLRVNEAMGRSGGRR